MRKPLRRFVERLLGLEAQNNEYYGHADVFRNYCNLSYRTPIRGLLQHGWSFGPGLPLVSADGDWLPKTTKMFLWNPSNQDLCRDQGFEHTCVIGAPLLYLKEPPPALDAHPRSIVIFPSHSVDVEPYIEDGLTLFNRYLAEIDPIIRSFSQATFCLYYREYENLGIRRLLEDRGLSVTTLGHRDRTGDFVQRFRDLVLRHEYMTTNSYSTSLFYALYLGRRAFVHGQTFANRFTPDKPDALTLHDSMRHRYPQLEWERFKDMAHEEIGAEEIGVGYQRSPAELRTEFGWTHFQQAETVIRRVGDFMMRRLTGQGSAR